MREAHSKGFNGWSQLAILLSLVGGGIIAGGVISIPIWKIMTNSSLLDMEKSMLNPENAHALQVIQIISTLCMFFFPTLAFAFICYRNSWDFLGFKSKFSWKPFFITILIAVCWIPFISALEEYNKLIPLPTSWKIKFDAMEKAYNDQILVIGQVKTWGQYLISLFIIALLPAITEEMLFRGGLQNMLTRWIKSPWAAIIITSILFSLIHLSWYGFFARLTLGIMLGVIFHYTHNIWLNILAHFINNALVVTVMFIMNLQGKSINTDVEEKSPLWLAAISLLLVIVLTNWLIRSISNIKKENVVESEIIKIDSSE